MAEKKSKFIYNYCFKLPDTTSNDSSDSTESVHSSQSKSTAQLLSNDNLSLDDENSWNNEYQNSDEFYQSDEIKYDPVLSSSDCSFFNDSTSDSSLVVTEYEVGNIPNETSINDTGHSQSIDGTHIHERKNILSSPPCFLTCLQCRKKNSNPYFQYCLPCFRNRKDIFKKKPTLKLKKITNSEKELINSEDSGLVFSQQSGTLTQKEDEHFTNENANYSGNLCNICLTRPKDGIFNHGKIAHVYSCYFCAKKIWFKTNICPVCNGKVRYVTKMITV